MPPGAWSGEELGASLRSLGLPVRTSWVCCWLQERVASGRICAATKEAAQAALSEAFLLSDMRETAEPQVPASLSSWHKQPLAGIFVLQLIEAVNINEPHKSRLKVGPSKHRCLKLALTDGHVVVAALEYSRIDRLKEGTLGKGAKFLVYGQPEVRRGIIFLQENNLQVLWGGLPPPKEEVTEDVSGHAGRCVQELQHAQRPPESRAAQGASATASCVGAPRTPPWGPPATASPSRGPKTSGQKPPTEEEGATSTRLGRVTANQVSFSTGQSSAYSRPSQTLPLPPVSPQGPPAGSSGFVEEDASSLLLDLDDIADAFEQDVPQLPPNRHTCGPRGVSQGPPNAHAAPQLPSLQRPFEALPPAGDGDPVHSPPQQLGPLQGRTLNGRSQGPPQGPPLQGPPEARIFGDPQGFCQHLSIPSHPASGKCSGACTSESYLPISANDKGSPRGPVDLEGTAAPPPQLEVRLGKEGALSPFWLFGAVVDAREGKAEEAEWELLVTDGLRVFPAVTGAATGQRMMQEVVQTSLFSHIPAVSQLRNVQGYFLLGIQGSAAETHRVRVLSFRLSAPSGEVTEKLKYLYSVIATGR
ncbi:hypothetical protein cyc_07572 [Cyclospora cayetanensis]|uniref:RecQ-mediated genome instability protein 1 n=1 Tax=Cyclospora cayetanensis TaxID=88456 RepID=A0A1D3CV45_9EIME|nr:hypothetical protein cyc_07572 [Cyclospora cayetanensis]